MVNENLAQRSYDFTIICHNLAENLKLSPRIMLPRTKSKGSSTRIMYKRAFLVKDQHLTLNQVFLPQQQQSSSSYKVRYYSTTK